MTLLSRIIKKEQEQDSIKPYQFFMDFQKPSDEPKEKNKRMQTNQEVADQLISDAMIQAQEILQVARQQGELLEQEIHDAASKEGYEEGLKQGYQQAYEDHTNILQQDIQAFEEELVTYIEDMELKKEKVLERYLDDLKKISISIAEKIIKTSLKSSGEVIKRMIIAATDKLKKTQWAKIYITKGDSNRLVKGDADLINELRNLSDHIKIVVMDNEEDGNCVIELPEEIIDVSVNTQLENIKDILNNARL